MVLLSILIETQRNNGFRSKGQNKTGLDWTLDPRQTINSHIHYSNVLKINSV